MAILRKTKLVVLFALVLFAVVLLLSPKVEATTPVPDGLYSAHVMDDIDSNPVYMQVRIADSGSTVVLGAGMYRGSNGSPVDTNSQLSTCLRTTYEEPSNEGDKMYKDYKDVFDINAMYTLFKTSTIYDTSGNTVTHTFPSAITQIGHGAFTENASASSSGTSLTSVVVPSSITEIGSDAFAKSGVTTVDLSKATNLANINSSTFNGCGNLQSIDLSSTKITTLETNSFISCTSLTSVKLPDTLTTIGNTAFMNTSELTQLTIPPNVTEINKTAFEDHSGSPKTKILKFTGDFNSSFHDMAVDTNTYVKLLYPAGNPTWENSSLVQSLVAQGKAASYIATTSQTPPADDVIYSSERTSTENGVYTFTSSGAYSDFTGVWVHGSAIPSSYYTATQNADGSVSITFTDSYARTLTSSEEYLLHFVFSDGFGIVKFFKDVADALPITQETTSSSEDNSEPLSEETEEQQTVNSEIEDTSSIEEEPTSSSEVADATQVQDGEEETGNSMGIVIPVLIIACIGGCVLIFMRARKNK